MYSLTYINADKKLHVVTHPDNRVICSLYDILRELGITVRMWDKSKHLMC